MARLSRLRPTTLLAIGLLAGCGKDTVVSPGASPAPAVVVATPSSPSPAASASPSPVPSPAANRQPEVHFQTTPAPSVGRNFTSTGPLTIQFNMCTSSDPDGDPLNFRMDLDGDGVFEVNGPTGADCRRSHRYEQSGPVSPSSFDPTICATDLLPSRTPAHPYQCRSYNVKVFRR